MTAITNTRYEMATDTETQQLFTGFVRRVETFRTILKSEIGKPEVLKQFHFTEPEMIHYTERWIDTVREDRTICDAQLDTEEDEDGNTVRVDEIEMLERMIAYLRNTAGGAMLEVFEQMDTHSLPTKFKREEAARLLDYPYCDCEIAVWQLELMEHGSRWYGTEDTFVLRLIDELVQEWMEEFMMDFIQDKLEKLIMERDAAA